MVPSSIRVLLVDDYEPWRRFASSTLQKKPGVRLIGEVADGLQAVQKSEELRPDLILLDIGLPTINGIEAARRIREKAPGSKILFFSEERSADVVQEVLQAGATGYVLKSDAALELLPAVEAVLQGKQFVSSTLAAQPSIKERRERVLVSNVVPPPSENAEITHCHEVALYPDDVSLVDGFVRFVECALKLGNSAIVLATSSHRAAILQKLKDVVNVEAAVEQGNFVAADIDDTLSAFFVDNLRRGPSAKNAADLFEEAAKVAEREHRRVAVCSECTSTLVTEANAENAILLERVFNDIAKRYGADILCGYLQSAFPNKDSSLILRKICAAHSSVRKG
jgi:DNA-binding NarL/FixJ family response regulator